MVADSPPRKPRTAAATGPRRMLLGSEVDAEVWEDPAATPAPEVPAPTERPVRPPGRDLPVAADDAEDVESTEPPEPAEPVVSAMATVCKDRIAEPTPNATASAPTRPT